MKDFVTNNDPNGFYGDILTERARGLSGIDNSRILFICFLPLLGLFLENYAVSKWAGMYLWASVVFLMILCCFLDYRAIKKLSTSDFGINRLRNCVWCAPLYIYRREKYCMRETNKVLMLAVFCAAALVMNGFFQGMGIRENNMPELIQNSYVQTLDNFSGSSPNIIGEQLENYMGEEINWECTKEGDRYTAVCTGEHEGKAVRITFVVRHDGFAYLGCGISQIEIGGKVLEGEDYTQTMREIFIPETIKEENNSQSSED